MSAYERYCDLHITKATGYDFPSEIVAYCQYQNREPERCVVGKKALIVLDFIENWEATAFRLLHHFKNDDVLFQGNYAVAIRKLAEMIYNHGAMLGNKTISSMIPASPL
jgi:hypothetical protein